MGKTSWALREAEVVSEMLMGITHYDIRNVSFTIPQVMLRRKEIPSKTIQVLDEPQRAAGSRTWQEEQQNLLVDDLMASNRYLKPVLMPTPLTGMIDNRLFEIATSQGVITRKAHCELYFLDRPQLDRKRRDPRTPHVGAVDFEKPSAVLWHEYLKAFNDDYEKRNKKAIEKVVSIEAEADASADISPLMGEALVAKVMEKPMDYLGRDGRISPTKVLSKLKVPYNRAQQAAASANEQLEAKEALEKAEREV